MFDVNDIDQAFQFARANAKLVIDELLTELDKRHLKQDINNRVMLNALKQNFTIGQIWERLEGGERKAIFRLLNPEDIIELRQDGASFEGVND